VTKVKQYLVVKMVEGLDRVAGLMAIPGLYSLEAAQQLVLKAVASEPGSNYLIQEVGAT
jgi:hypothetical protein